MQDPDLQSQLRLINDLLAVNVTDPQIELHWGQYMCIMVAGFLESSLQTVYRNYASQASDRNVARYVSGQLRSRVRNPDAGRFIETAGAFNPDWGKDLSAFINRNGRKDAIDKMQRNRNQSAHGNQSAITLDEVRADLPKCVEVVEFIESQCLAQPQSSG